jgi:hypothetical protein
MVNTAALTAVIALAWFNLRGRVREWWRRQRPSLLEELNAKWGARRID